MKASLSLLTLFVTFLLAFPAPVASVTLTYTINPSERVCFHTMSTHKNEKLAFYFAVQRGGDFDVDYDVIDPNGIHILGGTKERQGDFVFASKEVGEYSFCLSNGMSTVAEKVVDFDISVEHEVKADLYNPSNDLPSPLPKNEEANRKVEETAEPIHALLDDVYVELMNIHRMQKHFKTRENRNFATVKSTESRVFWFSVTECMLIVAVSVGQVVVIQGFFGNSGGKGLRV
jgi:hypothetical protein